MELMPCVLELIKPKVHKLEVYICIGMRPISLRLLSVFRTAVPRSKQKLRQTHMQLT